jgi:enoyl-CoA hydratase/carnithine racemase
MTAFKYLRTDLDADGILTVLLDRAPANAVDRDMYMEIAELFNNIDDHVPGVRVVILGGTGKHFCAGNDLDEFASMTPENGTERMWRVREAFYAISRCKVPVIGAIHGAALGTGVSLMGSCDFCVAEPTASIGLPELTVGVMGGARHLTRIVPQPLLRRMYFTGQPMAAKDLVTHGASIFLCEPGDLMAEARRFASRVAGYSPTAVRVSKRVLDRIEWMDLETGYKFEQEATVRMSGHFDAKEALAAFREKRPPQYQAEIDRTMFD